MYSVCCGLLAILAIVNASADDKKQQSLFDDPAMDARLSVLQVEPILGNDRILNNYIKCVVNRGPCTPDGKLLKELAPKAIGSACRPCNQLQKNLIRKGIKFVNANRHKELYEMLDIYDPDKTLRGDFLKFALEDVDF